MGTNPPVCDFGAPIQDFTLPDPATGKTVSLDDVKGPKGTLIVFICNHCPYVMAVIDRLVRDAKALQDLGVGVVAISSNDVETYPQDGPDQMVAVCAVAREDRDERGTSRRRHGEVDVQALRFGVAVRPLELAGTEGRKRRRRLGHAEAFGQQGQRLIDGQR